MRLLTKISISLAFLFTPAIAYASLLYNAEHDAAMKNLTAIESATVNWQYQCGKYSLIINAYATQSEINGRSATVTGKIMSGKATHDISEQLTKAISRQNILAGQMSIACNGDKGAFAIEFIPTTYAPDRTEGRTLLDIFSDGTVEGITQMLPSEQPK